MSYAIDVTRIQIRLRTIQGESFDGAVFVHPIGHADYRPESVGDRLNDPETRFLPCDVDGERQLVRLSSISYVVMAEPTPEVEALEAVGATRATAELWLRSGDRLTGELLYEAERGEERISDMLNRARSRFLMLVDQESTYFVQCDAIDRVKLYECHGQIGPIAERAGEASDRHAGSRTRTTSAVDRRQRNA